MDKLFIGQLWEKYTETKDVEWLAQAVEFADFGMNDRKEKMIKAALADFIRTNNGKKTEGWPFPTEQNCQRSAQNQFAERHEQD